jgi:hypothetical protein
VEKEQRVRQYENRLRAVLGHHPECAVERLGPACPHDLKLQSQRLGRGRHVAYREGLSGVGWV